MSENSKVYQIVSLGHVECNPVYFVLLLNELAHSALGEQLYGFC